MAHAITKQEYKQLRTLLYDTTGISLGRRR